LAWLASPFHPGVRPNGRRITSYASIASVIAVSSISFFALVALSEGLELPSGRDALFVDVAHGTGFQIFILREDVTLPSWWQSDGVRVTHSPDLNPRALLLTKPVQSYSVPVKHASLWALGQGRFTPKTRPALRCWRTENVSQDLNKLFFRSRWSWCYI
jgi:hypothetical protein